MSDVYGTNTTVNQLTVATTVSTAALIPFQATTAGSVTYAVSVSNLGTAVSTSLLLGSMATQNAGSVAITGGTISVSTLTATAGITVSAGGASISGGLTVVNSGLAVSSGGMTIVGTGSFTGAVTILSTTSIPAGGTAGAGLLISGATNFGVFVGSGAPTLAAAQGSLYLRSDGTATNTRAYIATSATSSWTAITTVA